MDTLRQRESNFSFFLLHPTAHGTIINSLNKGEEHSKEMQVENSAFPSLQHLPGGLEHAPGSKCGCLTTAHLPGACAEGTNLLDGFP